MSGNHTGKSGSAFRRAMLYTPPGPEPELELDSTGRLAGLKAGWIGECDAFQPSSDARFIMLVMAVETLLDPQPRPESSRAHVKDLLALTPAADLLTSSGHRCSARCSGCSSPFARQARLLRRLWGTAFTWT